MPRRYDSLPYEAPIASAMLGDTVQTLCAAAGFALLRDLANKTDEELVEHGFHEMDLRGIREWFRGHGVFRGGEFWSLVTMLERDAQGDGEGNPKHAKQRLIDLGVPWDPQATRAPRPPLKSKAQIEAMIADAGRECEARGFGSPIEAFDAYHAERNGWRNGQ